MPNSAVKPLILVVEDDPAVRNLIVAALEAHGLRHMAVETAHAAIAAASSQAPSIVLLDLGLPDMDGVKVVESVRAWSGMPIIVVSARSEDADKIRALDAGADDYLTKPFSVEELLARIRTTLRRLSYAQTCGVASEGSFDTGELHIDFDAGIATMDGEELHLTPIEYKLLCLLAHNADKVLTHQLYCTRFGVRRPRAIWRACASLWARCVRRSSPTPRIRAISNARRHWLPPSHPRLDRQPPSQYELR